jgi:gamma-butyrobetaine dioxygenase
MLPPHARSIDDVLALFASPLLDASYGEDLPIRDHMLQCAALAQTEGAGDALVAAALLHDLGWVLDAPHEETGALWIEPLLGPAVAQPIRLHVTAKRYLVATTPGYLERLSAMSRTTLEQQGGPLEPEACRAFESDPAFHAALRLRGWDDCGKCVASRVIGIDGYASMLEKLLLPLA